jgi:hypothetical protein
MRPLNAIVSLHPIEGSWPQLHRDTSFGGGAIYLERSTTSAHCGPNLAAFYTVRYPGGMIYSFYVVARLDTSQEVPPDAWCESTRSRERGYVQDFDLMTIRSVDLGNGATLLYGWRAGFEPVVLIVRALPTNSVWTNGDVFLVPKSMLGPALDAAGADLGARYTALLDIIQMPPSAPHP